MGGVMRLLKLLRGETTIMQTKTKELLKLTRAKNMKAVIHKKAQWADVSRFVD